MKIKTKSTNGIGILALHGKMMGGSEMDQIRDELKSFFGEHVFKIVIDLKHVSWMNSLGVGALMAAYTTALNANGEIRLSGLNEKVRSLMLLTQLSKVFKTYPAENEAVESYQA